MTLLTLAISQARDAALMEIVIVCIVMLVGVIYGYYTTSGSGIEEHPYAKIYGGAPGAHGPASASGRDDRVEIASWTRGTR